MEKVLVVHADRHPMAASIARAVAEQLAKRGLQAEVRSANKASDAWKYSAVIVGSPVSAGHWSRDIVHYLQAQAPDLAERPTWLFQCPGGSSSPEAHHIPPVVSRFCFEASAQPVKTFFADDVDSDVTSWAASIGDHLKTSALATA